MLQELRSRTSAAFYGKGMIPYQPSSTQVLIVALLLSFFSRRQVGDLPIFEGEGGGRVHVLGFRQVAGFRIIRGSLRRAHQLGSSKRWVVHVVVPLPRTARRRSESDRIGGVCLGNLARGARPKKGGPHFLVCCSPSKERENAHPQSSQSWELTNGYSIHQVGKCIVN